jgi:hypothetical protein
MPRPASRRIRRRGVPEAARRAFGRDGVAAGTAGGRVMTGNGRAGQRALWAGKIIGAWAFLVASMALTASLLARF